MDGGLLTAVRIAQNQAGVVRVVLDVNGVKDYTASLLSHPAQLIIELYPDSRGAGVRTAKAKGLSPRRILTRHVLRTSLIPVITFLGPKVVQVIADAIFDDLGQPIQKRTFTGLIEGLDIL